MTKWISPFSTQFDDSPRDTRDQKLPALRIVVHITGRQTYLNAEKSKTAPLQRIGEYFDKRGRPFAHYTVDPWGRIACHAHETETPYAQGWADYKGRKGIIRRLADERLVVPPWWTEYWSSVDPNITSPIDLVDSSCFSGNDRAVAIEFIQWGNQYLLTIQQYIWGSVLVDDIARRHGIEKTPRNILGHEDLDPWGRGDVRGGWDPGARRPKGDRRFDYQGLLHPPLAVDSHTAIMTPTMPDWAKW